MQATRGVVNFSSKGVVCNSRSSLKPGTDVVIFKIFSPKNLATILAFFAQTTASFDLQI
jgi:hypothetical protein